MPRCGRLFPENSSASALLRQLPSPGMHGVKAHAVARHGFQGLNHGRLQQRLHGAWQRNALPLAACRLPLAASCCSRRLRNVRPTSLRYPTLHRTKPAAAHHDGCSLAEGWSRLCRLALLPSAWQHRAVATRPGISMHGEDACFPRTEA
jgi:hypothetical protein